MRRLLVVAVVFLMAAALFADDALLLPVGVWRARVTGAYSTTTEVFDDSADRGDIVILVPVDKITAFNIGAALEYGIVEGVNIAAQWIPGYNVSSSFDSTAPIENAKVNGAYDLFLGAKVQLLGDQGLMSKNDTMRLAAAAGVIVPLPGADFDEEASNLASGDDFILADSDKHAFAIGGRAFFDYVLMKNADKSDMVYVNLYSEFIKYFKRDLATSPFAPGEAEMNYGYQLTLELEPHFEMPVAEGMIFKSGLPLTYVMWPETEVDGTGDNLDGYSLVVRPKASLFLTKTPMPLEFELSYMYTLAGKNAEATSAIAFQLIAFFKF